MAADAEDYPDTATAAANGADDAETEFVPPPTEVAAQAWASEDPATEVLSRPWRSVWAVAGIGVACAVVVAFAIFGVIALFTDGQQATPLPSTAAPTTSVMTVVATPPPTVIVSPPSTVTVAPPSTVTIAPPPATVTEQAAVPPAPAGTDIFTICPDGHEGVVGGRTTCAFAANVRRMFYATGMSNSFTAYSPVTGDAYQMTCVGRYNAYFSDGTTTISTRCYGGDNAEVVIW